MDMKQKSKKANVEIYSMRVRAGSLLARISTGIGLILALLLLAFTLTSNGGIKTAAGGSEAKEPASVPLPPIAQGNDPGQRVEVELVSIRPSGFEPSEITRPRGFFIIAVENRSGLDEVELTLAREAGDRLHQVLVPRRKLNWKQGLDLTPGRYVLTEASNPEWQCTITITSQ
jgi:hypothetical protein